jgi:serine/threonine-protein kinase HipA
MSAIDANADALAVFMDKVRVGTLHNEEPLSFSYDDAWLADPAAKPIDPQIPLQAGKIASIYVYAFFENLLPEGDQRKLVSLRHHVSTVFGLLATVGGDTAGSCVLLPLGQLPQPPLYRAMTWDQVDKLLHVDSLDAGVEEDAEADPDDLTKPRISVSGAQLKMLISLDGLGNPLQPMGTSPSTHILKPDMVRADINLFATAVNETIVMRAAGICGMPTAGVSYQAEVRACLVERYDRVREADGSLRRLWQADFCQLAGKPSAIKYEADGGPTFKDCFDLLSAHTVRPAIDQRSLLRWLFFNLYVGNNDSHAKNLSILRTPDGLRLAPFYDLMSTRVYSGLGRHFALSVGGEFSPGKIEKSHLVTLAASLGVSPKYLMKIAQETAGKVESAIPEAVRELMPNLAPPEKIIAERIQQKILSITKKLKNRFFQSANNDAISSE